MFGLNKAEYSETEEQEHNQTGDASQSANCKGPRIDQMTIPVRENHRRDAYAAGKAPYSGEYKKARHSLVVNLN